MPTSQKHRSRSSDRVHRHTRLLPDDLRHLVRLTDDTGMLQHARGRVPDRHHGYCTDDNARALIVAVRARPRLEDKEKIDALIDRYLAFLLHAYRQESHAFSNFLSYDRRWREEEGSDDCQGRAIWALGVTAGELEDHGRRDTAAGLLVESLPCIASTPSLRAAALALLGLNRYLSRYPKDGVAKRVRARLSERLVEPFLAVEREQRWPWPEDTLTYANARLPHALIETGADTYNDAMRRIGLLSLTWLDEIQRTDTHFSPVGNRGWFPKSAVKAGFDQQPIEAEAMVSACLAAHRVTGDPVWLDNAGRAFQWFLGNNDGARSLFDPDTGGCHDGLGLSEVNENQGAESTLAWLLALLQVLEQHITELHLDTYPLVVSKRWYDPCRDA